MVPTLQTIVLPALLNTSHLLSHNPRKLLLEEVIHLQQFRIVILKLLNVNSDLVY